MKRNSAFRCTFNEDDTLTVHRIQTPVGAFGIYNIPTTLSYGYMLHDTGVYYTDGNTVENLFKISKRFETNVIKNTSTFALAAGYTDHVNKTMQIGMPYVSRFHTTYWPIDAQFVYTYNDGVLGWSVNTGIPATCWTRYRNTDVFGSFDGSIYAMNTQVTEPWAYSDAGVPIDFAIRTRFSDGGDRVRFKFYRNAIFQFGTEGDVTTRVYYSSNFSNVENPLQLYKISGSTTTDGKISWRNDKFLKTLRDTMAMRVAQISFTLISAVRRSSAPLYGVFLEGFRTNSRLINQKETPGNTRT
jgi:hypothetical protein